MKMYKRINKCFHCTDKLKYSVECPTQPRQCGKQSNNSRFRCLSAQEAFSVGQESPIPNLCGYTQKQKKALGCIYRHDTQLTRVDSFSN